MPPESLWCLVSGLNIFLFFHRPFFGVLGVTIATSWSFRSMNPMLENIWLIRKYIMCQHFKYQMWRLLDVVIIFSMIHLVVIATVAMVTVFVMNFFKKMFFFVYLLSNGCYALTWLPQKVPIYILQLNTNPLVPIMCLYLKNWQIYSYFQFSWFKQ